MATSSDAVTGNRGELYSSISYRGLMREKTLFLDLLTQNSHKTVHNLSIATCSQRAFVGAVVGALNTVLHSVVGVSPGHCVSHAHICCSGAAV